MDNKEKYLDLLLETNQDKAGIINDFKDSDMYALKQGNMHDISYFDRSVPIAVGKQQRSILGAELFTRAEKTVEILKSIGIDIQHKTILGKGHNNECGIGVNELGDKFINDTYKSSITNKEIKDELWI